MTTGSVRLQACAGLVLRAQAGNAEAMHDLIAVVRPAVLHYCRYRLGSYAGGSDAADDVTQETCLAVASVLPSYTVQGPPFSAWVYAIAANKVADSQRRWGRAALLVDELPEQVDPSRTPEETAIASMELETALGLVARLPDGMREVVLRRAGGATAKMVAADLGISAGAVDVSFHRAVTRLRQFVDESDELRELFASSWRPVTPRVVRAA
jgi:RNA polymerase sigma-70 factor (ECF subfamily)